MSSNSDADDILNEILEDSKKSEPEPNCRSGRKQGNSKLKTIAGVSNTTLFRSQIDEICLLVCICANLLELDNCCKMNTYYLIAKIGFGTGENEHSKNWKPLGFVF